MVTNKIWLEAVLRYMACLIICIIHYIRKVEIIMNDFTLGEIRKCKEDEVKPCPFCGGKEIVIDKYKHNSGQRYRIFCTGCMAMIDPGYAQQEYTVIKMWNKRKVKKI
mgnify:CR=1 FL=1